MEVYQLAQFTASPVAMLLVSVFLGTCGQLLLKTGINQAGGKSTEVGSIALVNAIRSIGSPWVFTGFVCYGISSILWLMILKKVQLSWAYPMISLSYVFVVLLSALILHERPHWTITIPGLVLIIAGVSLIGLGSGK